MIIVMNDAVKPARFHRAAKAALLELPAVVRKAFGHALWLVQNGETPGNATPFEGSSGGDVMKLVERFETDTYRCVYIAKFEHYVYILHVFKRNPRPVSGRLRKRSRQSRSGSNGP